MRNRNVILRMATRAVIVLALVMTTAPAATVKNYSIKTVTVTTTFAAVNATRDCNYFTIVNTDATAALLIRSDSADSTTEISIPAGASFQVMTTPSDRVGFRWSSGETVAYVKVASGTLAAVATFGI